MKYGCILLIGVGLLVSACSTPNQHTVAWGPETTVALEGPARDMAFTANGRWLFVLSGNGEVLVYSRDGKLNRRIEVGPQVDQIKVGPAGNRLYLGSRGIESPEVVDVDLIQHIEAAGSPFKGPSDAPVVMAVFGDFQ